MQKQKDYLCLPANQTHITVIEASGNKTYGTISVTSSVPARINAYDNMGRYATWTGRWK